MKQQLSGLKDLKEVRLHGTKSFPCAIYRTHSIKKGVFVKHHWHDEIEILYFILLILANCTVLLLRRPKVIGKMLLSFRLIFWGLILVMKRRFA